MAELWDLYDRNNKPTGETIQRGKWIPKDKFHRVVEGWIRTSDGRYLLQQRSKKKKNYPNYWSCTAIGSVLAGEEPEDAMIREMKEEMGIQLTKDELILDQIITTHPGHYYIYRIEKDIEITEVRIDMEEVQAARFLTYEELKDWIFKKKLTKLSYYHDFFNNWK
ncbi:NUDIX domain-containing protein [Peptoniphilus sp. KCTC 25270]|uniref:NUDIX hydrolase n=1 Tax=Peptoniphilus sp. KCTC 25270 TaxID=2897414 RepID=UPI001E4B4373|nr:NUDIX domain-containing protein [Peptoniphilus sp. KCTC 25270]MCD1147849.1 NUDIX domain-containing protein [Peptoniphilus sp. KCTC 25270]